MPIIVALVLALIAVAPGKMKHVRIAANGKSFVRADSGKPRSQFAWSVGPEPEKRRTLWYQFDLRTLLILAAIVGVACGVVLPLLQHR